MNLKIRKDFEELQPSMSEDEYKSLLHSMKERGYDKAFPIIIDETDTILDGHHRYKASSQLKITPEVTQRKGFKDDFDKMDFIWLCSLRRNLNLWQKAEQAKKKEALEQQKADARSKAGKTPVLNSTQGLEVGRVTEILAKQVGIGNQTLQRAFKIMEEASEEVKKKLREGEWVINYASTGLNSLKQITDTTIQKDLTAKWENEEVLSGELKSIVSNTLEVQKMLEALSPKARSIVEAEVSKNYWKKDLSISDAKELIAEAEGHAIQEKFEIEGNVFPDKIDAISFANKYQGTFEGQTITWKFKFPKKILEKVKAALKTNP